MRQQAPEQIAVLLVDDDPDDYLLTKDLLSKLDGARYDVQWASDHRSAVRAADEGNHDVYLVDYRLGAEDGLELIRELIANGHDVPVIVLTGQGNRDVDVEAAEAGAADYLVKGEVSPALLERTIRYAMQGRAHLRALRESEEGLRQAQRMEAVGQLAGGVAHDFNNMMSVVIGFSEFVLAHLDETHPQRAHVEEILHAGKRASTMTQQLLAFSRKQVLEPKVFDLNTVVGGIESMLQRLIGEDIELVSVVEGALDPIEADPGQLEQVLMNLVINARDAMPEGGRLTIETANVELDEESAARHLDVVPGPYVMLRVSDTGVGMDAETLHQIFEPFFTTKEEGKGTGLGLATVFGIVKQSGGDIHVYSERGRGTTFKIYLPRTEAQVERVEPVVVSAKPARGSETILLVEDEELVRSLERKVLEEGGYTVLEALTSNHALELSEQHDGVIDLLLTDVVMPQLSGRELADLLAPQRPEMRILYASGYTADAITRHGVLEPGIAFLPKPLTPTSLLRKVREVLDTPLAVRLKAS
jgi:signal transduction histidine kinase